MQERNDQAEAQRRLALEARYRKAAGPLLNALGEAGFPVDYITQLTELGVNYKPVVPLLIEWLPRVDDPAVKEGIVRALIVRWARRIAVPALIQEFMLTPIKEAGEFGHLKWTIGNALSVVADESAVHDLMRIARDKRHGRDREMVVVALGNVKRPEAIDVLLDLLGDDEVAGHAIIALGKLRPGRARERIEPFLQHRKAWVRRVARTALRRIDKSG